MMIPDGKEFRAAFRSGLVRELNLTVPEPDQDIEPLPVELVDDPDLVSGPDDQAVPDAGPVRNRTLSGTEEELLSSFDGRPQITRRQIVYATAKRGVKVFAAAAASTYISTGDPMKALVGGVAFGLLGAGSKGGSEAALKNGKPGLAAALNPIDTFMKICLELLRAYRISMELKLKS